MMSSKRLDEIKAMAKRNKGRGSEVGNRLAVALIDAVNEIEDLLSILDRHCLACSCKHTREGSYHVVRAQNERSE